MKLSDAEQLSQLALLLGAQNDAALARKLDISTAAMSKLRNGSSNMSGFTRLKALELLGYEWAGQALRAITNEGFAAHIDAARKLRR